MHNIAQGTQWIKVSFFIILVLVVFRAPRHRTSPSCLRMPADIIRLDSRQAIQKYIKANNDLGVVTDAMFKSHVNRAIASGEKSGDFLRPKGEFRTFRSHPNLLCLHALHVSTKTRHHTHLVIRY